MRTENHVFREVRDELVQVAAVAVAILEQLDEGFADVRTKRMYSIFAEVAQERKRQDGKWGVQSHSYGDWMTILGEEYGEACQAVLDSIIFPTEKLKGQMGVEG